MNSLVKLIVLVVCIQLLHVGCLPLQNPNLRRWDMVKTSIVIDTHFIREGHKRFGINVKGTLNNGIERSTLDVSEIKLRWKNIAILCDECTLDAEKSKLTVTREALYRANHTYKIVAAVRHKNREI